MRVMMSAAGSVVAPGIIRHLQSLGHHVIGHDCGAFSCTNSAANDAYRSPPTYLGSSVYLGFLNSILLAERIDLYLPFLDEELRMWSFESDLPRQAACSPTETLSIFTNKADQQRAFEKAGLNVAPSPMSVMLKPLHGRGGKGVIKIGPIPGYEIQQFIDGDEFTVDVLTGRDGEFLFAVPRLRIQANGVSVIGQIRMDDDIIELAREIVTKFKFAGPINIQMIRERDTGKLYIIELNPRLSGSCMFTVMGGFDILAATINLWSGGPFIAPAKIDSGLVIRRHYVEERL